MRYFYPNLFIPGAAKSGTTSLHELLDYHSEICMSSIKEPVYWNKDFDNPKRVKDYGNLFLNKEAKVYGESTTSYMYFPEFIINIKENFKDLPKFIFILRNPIDRCYSHYWWMVGRGQEKRSFKESMELDLKREFQNYEYTPNYYYHFGLYGKWLSKFYNNFDPDTIKVITLEQLSNNTLSTLNECYDFLGLSKLESIPNIKSNPTSKLKYPKLYHFISKSLLGKYKYTRIAKYFLSSNRIDRLKKKLRSNAILQRRDSFNYPALKPKERLWLKTIYENDITKLKQLTGLEFNEWTDFKD